MNPDEVLLNVLKARDKASPSPSQEQSLREAILDLVFRDGASNPEITTDNILALIQESNRHARYDELADLNTKCAENGWHSEEVVPMFVYLSERFKALKDHQGGEI